jgi:hypothetical protein
MIGNLIIGVVGYGAALLCAFMAAGAISASFITAREAA